MREVESHEPRCPHICLAQPISRFLAATVLFALCLAIVWPTDTHHTKTTWLDLISPLRPGDFITKNYRLSPPRRGQEQDVVFMAHHVEGNGVAELHIVNRGQWSGAIHTKSFGIGFEEPRSTGPRQELAEVTRALARAIEANDKGGLGPVNSIPLRASTTVPLITQTARSLNHLEGCACVFCIFLAFLLIGTLPRGSLWVSLAFFAIGLSVRTLHLNLPFLWDQDVQRVQIAASSFSEVLTGVGINDRHPPFYFVVLHFAQYLGQAEWIVRLPAAVCGSLVGPAIIYATKTGSCHSVVGKSRKEA